jgi:ATP-dependent exoDNAse (exonuclease V) beta subunit
VGDDSVVGGGRRDDGEYLTLSTIHSAKGREWDCVYVIQVIEGGLPSAPSLGSEDDDVLEEERRLLYVAMTRARYGLTLFVPRRRRSFSDGSSTFKDCYPSRFLSHRVRSTCTENTGASPTPTPSGRPRTEPTPWDDPDPWIEPPTWDENNPFADDDPWPPGENSDSAADTGDGELYYDYNDV